MSGRGEEEEGDNSVESQLRTYGRVTEPTSDELARLSARLEAPNYPERLRGGWGLGLVATATAVASLVWWIERPEDGTRVRGAETMDVQWVELEGVEAWELEPARRRMERAAATCALSASGVTLTVAPRGELRALDGQGELGRCVSGELGGGAFVRSAPEGRQRRFRVLPASR